VFGRATIRLGIGPHSSSYSCAAADKISTDLRHRAVPLRYLLVTANSVTVLKASSSTYMS